ncbi:hypothetical protein WNY37_04055 [Henriciella sp. AS95]
MGRKQADYGPILGRLRVISGCAVFGPPADLPLVVDKMQLVLD